MKQIFLICALAAATVFSACTKTAITGCTDPNSINYDPGATESDNSCQYVQPVQKSLIMLFTATWCDVCGRTGEPGFNQGVRLIKDDAVPVTVHFSNTDPLHNKTAADLLAYSGFNGSSPPWYTEGSKILFKGAYSDTNYTANKIKTQVNATISNIPLAAIHVNKSLDGNTVKATVATKFFDDAQGDYTLSVYVLENGVFSTQKEGSDIHNHVLRGAMTPTFGEAIVTGSAAKDNQVLKNYELNLGSGWNASNIQIAAVLWKKEANGTYTFINCNLN